MYVMVMSNGQSRRTLVCSLLSEPRPVPLCVMLQCFKRLQQPSSCQRTLSALDSLYEINPNVRNMKPLEYSILAGRLSQIKEELRQGVKKPYQEVLDVYMGDPHKGGVKPLSFVRQVLAACLYPQLVNSSKLPADVRQRAQRLLGRCDGGSVGSYTATRGIPETLIRVSEFITRRDGGVPSNPENIFLSPGSQWSLSKILHVLLNPESSPRNGVLSPVPCHNTTTMSVTGLGAVVVPYYLSEEQGWELQVEELHRAMESAKGVCNPIALYIVNPGNPDGHVQSRKSMQEVIRFVSERKLFLLADEVYQDYVFGENSEFVSYKRVLSEMGPPLSDTVELASFHSASKGWMGECGLRTGYMELVNLDPAVMKHIFTMFSTDTCAPVLGQIALDLMLNPPQPGEPSYPLYHMETQNIKNTLAGNGKRAVEVVNSLPGLCCQPLEGGAFAFPKVYLPPSFIQKAKEAGLEPDTFYCSRLLDEAGLLVGPGTEYGQKEGTYHIRFCILTSAEIMEEVLTRLTCFHKQFMKDFS
ncbi:alanine aminotransferase 1 isoform X3 [Sparus aurata]|uniref:alanine aminotransferase 1 isoform X3 n=1 Tax=Sparus aurata TaxID=8175 RepID=UPI0011C1A04F|nr:alanine aminotransferase 1-like isoform X3 [Sparus aurata]